MAAVISLVLLACAPAPARQAQAQIDGLNWASPKEYIAGTEKSRLRAARALGFARGRWIVAYISTGCRDCDAVVPALNNLAKSNRVVAITVADAREAKEWGNRLGASFPIKSVSESRFEELGAVVMPTVVLFVDGKAQGARAPSLE